MSDEKSVKGKKRRKGNIVLVVFLVLAFLIVVFVLKTLMDAGEFKRLKYHSSLECNTVEGVLSSEDIVIDPISGTAFISSGIRGIGLGGDRDRGGAIYGYDLNSENPELVDLTKDFSEELFPHGLGLYSDPEGWPILFVVNHRHDKDYVEIFEYDGEKLVHRRSVSGDLMHNPNDVVPVGPDSFYVTNDHGFRTFRGQMLEDFLQLPRSYVLYFSHEKFSIAADGLNYANGINLSPDGRTVYVAETIGGRVNIFGRDVKTGKLTRRGRVVLKTGADNISVDEEGNLWIGAHPKLLTFAKHAKNQELLSPSQVLKISAAGEGDYNVDEIYLNDGSELSGSSVAAVYKNKVLIGGVFAPKFLVCEMK